VLVSAPEPAVVVYDATGAETSTTTTSSSGLLGAEPPTVSGLAGVTNTLGAAPPAETVQVRDLRLAWSKSGALGLPAVVGDQLMVPVQDGLAVFASDNGNAGIVPATVTVDRGGYQGRVDAAAVGAMIVETRGDQVVGLS